MDPVGVDLVAAALIELRVGHEDSRGFIAIPGDLGWRDAPRNAHRRVERARHGVGTCDPASRRRWSRVEEAEFLRGHNCFDPGDDPASRARRAGEGP